MINTSKDMSKNKPLRSLAAWLARGVRSAGSRLLEKDDARARQYGWQIAARHGGLGRVYRDPRFDCLIRCPECHGSGEDEGDEPCCLCFGAGRIKNPSSQTSSGR